MRRGESIKERPVSFGLVVPFAAPFYTSGMRSRVPPWVGKTADLSDTERYAAMTPAQRLACFVEVCELSRRILEDRPDRREVLAREEPMPPEAEQTWLRLVAEARRARFAR
jgi:hypothetical protein